MVAMNQRAETPEIMADQKLFRQIMIGADTLDEDLRLGRLHSFEAAFEGETGMGNELMNRQGVKHNGRTIGFVFDDVPDHLKKPPGPGPFEQVPEGFSAPGIGLLGGLWWRVTPFNPTPWAALSPPAEPVYPPGFIDTFGPPPDSNNYHYPGGKTQFQVDTNLWRQNLSQYEGDGSPPAEFDPIKVELANAEAVEYEMGEGAFYSNQYGNQVRFPDSDDPAFQARASAYVNHTGQVIVMYQNRLTNQGIVIPATKMHPLAPPVLLKRQDELREKKKV
jgi:hypothetical protein